MNYPIGAHRGPVPAILLQSIRRSHPPASSQRRSQRGFKPTCGSGRIPASATSTFGWEAYGLGKTLVARPILQEYDASTVEELGMNPARQLENLGCNFLFVIIVLEDRTAYRHQLANTL